MINFKQKAMDKVKSKRAGDKLDINFIDIDILSHEDSKKRVCIFSWWNKSIIAFVRYLHSKFPSKCLFIRGVALKLMTSRDTYVSEAEIVMDDILGFSKYGEPKMCVICGCDKFNEEIIDMLDGGGVVLEKKSRCSKCGCISGYWAHGSWVH